jgi:hypothetical protein
MSIDVDATSEEQALDHEARTLEREDLSSLLARHRREAAGHQPGAEIAPLRHRDGTQDRGLASDQRSRNTLDERSALAAVAISWASSRLLRCRPAQYSGRRSFSFLVFGFLRVVVCVPVAGNVRCALLVAPLFSIHSPLDLKYRTREIPLCVTSNTLSISS